MAPEELSSDAITADFRILQRRRGHRYALDDLATAWEAAQLRSDATRYLDLGCGIGSVLLMVSWRLPHAEVWGIEAQAQSFALAERNVALNELTPRASLIHGDLRDVARDWPHGPIDLVTGTPPYLPVGTALASPDPQRAAARLELRGGVEDYLLAASRVLADDGVVVICADGRKPERVLDGAKAAGLMAHRRRDIVPRPGASPLFAVWTLGRHHAELEHVTLVTRDAEGHRTADANRMRAVFGLGEDTAAHAQRP